MRRWARREFDIELRAATATVGEIRAAGQDIRVASYAPTDGVDYAMFSGGGVAWAEEQMKAGVLRLAEADTQDQDPDLSGLSCRWSNLEAKNGAILSLVIKPGDGISEKAFAKVARSVIAASDGTGRGGHPVPALGPSFRFPPVGLSLEAHVSHGARPLWVQKLALLASNLMIWALFRFNIRTGNFTPQTYRAQVGQNADFRKFDDGLKMTLDCDAETQKRIEGVLRGAADKGLIRYGMHAQDEALMTCLVPSATDNTHMHFVDGAAGGYARAAEQLR